MEGIAQNGVTLLIVEDHDDSRAVYRTLFEHYGYMVIEADNGLDGIEMARQLRPGAILMDIAMPGINGLEATRRLQSNGTSDIPVIIMTAHARGSDIIEAFDAGATAYISKPCSPREIATLVHEALRCQKDLLESQLKRYGVTAGFSGPEAANNWARRREDVGPVMATTLEGVRAAT